MIIFYKCDYIAHKQKCMITIQGDTNSHPESELTKLVSRGNLDFPNEEYFDLPLYLYSHFKSVDDKSCINYALLSLQNALRRSTYAI